MKPDSCLLPTDSDILDSPEVASLAVLESALAVAHASLHAHLPDLVQITHRAEPPWPEPLDLHASLLVGRIDELRWLVSSYREQTDLARRRACSPRGDGLPF